MADAPRQEAPGSGETVLVRSRSPARRRPLAAADYRRGHIVVAVRDLTAAPVGAELRQGDIARKGVLGFVVGPSVTDPEHRVNVAWMMPEGLQALYLPCLARDLRPAPAALRESNPFLFSQERSTWSGSSCRRPQ